MFYLGLSISVIFVLDFINSNRLFCCRKKNAEKNEIWFDVDEIKCRNNYICALVKNQDI